MSSLPCSALPPGASIDEEDVWMQVIRHAPDGAVRAALFLDRDGVVVEEVHYLHRLEDTRLVPGAADVISRANGRGIPVVLVTNQAGIGRGIYGWDDFISVQEKILDDLARLDARVDGVFACPHHADGPPPYNHPDHPARKPNPGMLLRAARLLKLDLSASWIVGDRAADLMAGRRAGLAGGVHVFRGHGSTGSEREDALGLAEDGFLVRGAPSILEASELVPLLTAP